MKFGVVILAAGASRRMGQPKLLLPWNGQTVIGYLIDQWRSIGAEQVAMVVSADNVELNRELDRLGISDGDRIVNSKPQDGMFSSIKCAAQSDDWSSNLTHFVITLGDQPHVRISTLRQLLKFSAENADRICQPSLNSRPKHPVILPRRGFRELASTHAETLKEYLAQRSEVISLVELEDEGLSLDLDTPKDYEEAMRLYGF